MSDVGAIVRRVLPVVAVVGLLGLLVVVAAMSGPEVTGLPLPGRGQRVVTPPPPPTAGPTAAPTPTVSTAPPSVSVPGWLAWVPAVFGVLLLAALVVLVVHLVRLYLRHRRPRDREDVDVSPLPVEVEDETGQRLRAAVDAGIEDLDDDGTDPRRAVIACWLRLEAAAAAAGTPRAPADTPGDLVARMLAAHQVSAAVLRGCADLYRKARYAPAEVEESMRTQAREALGRLRAELAAGPAADVSADVASEVSASTRSADASASTSGADAQDVVR
ncbi:DUF4129 domain-containing protein [Actinopolymorpha sp. NPDC004070]|uniref:DUF4129 domain-containing protein n=1 Tax=Actinopolymorpha sp. NPDC004070 TaxID=3154548 RepID=UPI0033AECA5A